MKSAFACTLTLLCSLTFSANASSLFDPMTLSGNQLTKIEAIALFPTFSSALHGGNEVNSQYINWDLIPPTDSTVIGFSYDAASPVLIFGSNATSLQFGYMFNLDLNGIVTFQIINGDVAGIRDSALTIAGVDPVATPEPATFMAVAGCLIGLVVVRKRRSQLVKPQL